jgi:tetratricopeptide (TPR) repeat protein
MKKITIIGVIILISISPLFRGLYFSYETYGFMTALAVFCILYFIIRLRSNEPVHLNKLFTVIGLTLIGAAAISVINAANPRENLGSILLYSELLIVYMVLYDYFYGKKQQFIRCLMIPVVLAGAVCAVVGLMALTGRFNILEVTTAYNRIGSTFQYANTAAIYFVICLIFVITLVNTETNAFIRAAAAGLGSIFIYAFFMTGSRGGYLVLMLIIPVFLLLLPSSTWINSVLGLLSMTAPVFITLKGFNSATAQHDNLLAAMNLAFSFIIAFVMYYVLSLIYRVITKDKEIFMPKGTRLVMGIILAAVLVLAAVFRKELLQLLPDVMANRLNRLITEGFYDNNIQTRLHYNIDALKLISQNWLVGLGGGGWKAMYQSVQDYYYTAAFVHNHYFQVFVENGIMGFISFISLVVVSFAECIYSYIRYKDTSVRVYTAGILCALVSLAGHAAGDFDLSFVSLMLLLWTMFAACMTGMKSTGDDKVPGGRWDTNINGVAGKLIITVVCSALFTFFGMYFLGAYNENIGFKYNQEKEYRIAAAYYEEAHRFDPANSFYSFELAKLYHYFGRTSNDTNVREKWLEKARQAGERSVEGNRNYPAYMNTLVKIYNDSSMPLEALDMAQKLVACQKYNSEVYELLASSLIEAARYYEDIGDTEKAGELLKMCIDIDQNPYLRRSGITKPYDIGSEKIISKYRHSDKLAGYFEEAAIMLGNIE